jgi:SAM-dependent methyltransferase
MELSKIEFRAMNNPIRRWVLKNVEFKLFKQHLKKCNINLNRKTILAKQIELAKKRRINADFFIGDATDIHLVPQTFDAAFIFGVLHHIPEWEKALCEIAKALKSGGFLLVEEPSITLINFANRLGFKHPEKSKFRWAKFEEGLKLGGFDILVKEKMWWNTFQSYLCIKNINVKTS